MLRRRLTSFAALKLVCIAVVTAPASTQPMDADPLTWADFIAVRTMDTRLSSVSDLQQAAKSASVVNLTFDPAKLAIYEQPWFVEGLIEVFEGVRTPVLAGDTIRDAASRACYSVSATYNSALDRIVREGISFLPSDGRDVYGGTAVHDADAPLPADGWISLPYCIPKLTEASYAIVEVSQSTDFLSMYWDQSVAVNTPVLTTGQISLARMAGISEVALLEVDTTNPFIHIPRVYEKIAREFNLSANLNLKTPATIQAPDPSLPRDRTIMVAPFTAQAVLRESVPDSAMSRRLIAQAHISAPALDAADKSGFVAPLSSELALQHCASPSDKAYGREAEIERALTLNERFRLGYGATREVRILMADTGLVSPQQGSFQAAVRPSASMRRYGAAMLDDGNADHGSRVLSLLVGHWLPSATRAIYIDDLAITPVNVFWTGARIRARTDTGVIEAFKEVGGVAIANFSVSYQTPASFIADYPNTLFVIAAGNDNQNVAGKNLYPAASGNRPNVITVAALDSTFLQRAGFSNRGAISAGPPVLGPDGFPDDTVASPVTLAAPGCRIGTVAQRRNAAELPIDSTGTSFSAPLVTFAATLIAREGASTAAMIKSRLLITADHVASLQGVEASRRLNIERAIGIWYDQLTTMDGQMIPGRASFVGPDGEPWFIEDPMYLCAAEDARASESVDLQILARISREYVAATGQVAVSSAARYWKINEENAIATDGCSTLNPGLSVLMRDEAGNALQPAIPLTQIRDLTLAPIRFRETPEGYP